jgi:hypothetical protein
MQHNQQAYRHVRLNDVKVVRDALAAHLLRIANELRARPAEQRNIEDAVYRRITGVAIERAYSDWHHVVVTRYKAIVAELLNELTLPPHNVFTKSPWGRNVSFQYELVTGVDLDARILEWRGAPSTP